MAASRKDSRGYALRTGECQRKDGRYSYSYTDKNGQRHSIYDHDLMELRKKERVIIRNIEDGLDPQKAERTTLNQVYDAYMAQKYNLKETTKVNYIYTYDHLVRETFGKRRIATIKYTDIKTFYYSLMSESGLKPATVENVHTQIHPALQMAVRDGLLRVNPSDGVMAEIKKSHIWVKDKRHSLTIPEQKAFMNFLCESTTYYGWKSIIIVLLGTGLRIGEALGLTWADLDFESRVIHVDHNLVHRKIDDSGVNVHINTPKTAAGTRTVPMIQQVYDAFLEEYQIQQITGFCQQEIDGYSGFVFTSSSGNVTLPQEVNKAIHSITEDYNKQEKAAAKKERRSPLLIPEFSAHHLRHTFCTRFCENESNLKVIQSVMGHSDISTTMDIYAEATEEKGCKDVQSELLDICKAL